MKEPLSLPKFRHFIKKKQRKNKSFLDFTSKRNKKKKKKDQKKKKYAHSFDYSFFPVF